MRSLLDIVAPLQDRLAAVETRLQASNDPSGRFLHHTFLHPRIRLCLPYSLPSWHCQPAIRHIESSAASFPISFKPVVNLMS